MDLSSSYTDFPSFRTARMNDSPSFWSISTRELNTENSPVYAYCIAVSCSFRMISDVLSCILDFSAIFVFTEHWYSAKG